LPQVIDGVKILADYASERDRLRRQLVDLLQDDSRIAGAWLRGSFGRGKADGLSDLDVHVAVEDQHMPADDTQRHAFVARLGRPLLTQDAGWVPPGGFNWCVLYPARMGALEVDWMVWPASVAEIVPPAEVMFNRDGVRWSEFDDYRMLRQVEFPQDPASRLQHSQASFWLFLFIAIKYVVRGRAESATEMLAMAEGQLTVIDEILAKPSSNRRTPASPRARIQTLADEAVAVHDLLLRAGGINTEECVRAVLTTLDTLVPTES
jgi:predicted nucleotidyltransferase